MRFRLRSRQDGFTLVEITLVLAITSLLVVGYVVGQGAQQRNNAFTVGIDKLQSQMKSLQTLTAAAVTNRATNGGTSPYVVEGKVAFFYHTNRSYQVWTLIGLSGSDASNYGWELCNPSTQQLPGGVVYTGNNLGDGNNTAVVFRTNPNQIYAVNNYDATEANLSVTPLGGYDPNACDAAPATSLLPNRSLKNTIAGVVDKIAQQIVPNALAAASGQVLDPNNYTDPSFNTAIDLHFPDPNDSSRVAVMHVDPPNNIISWKIP